MRRLRVVRGRPARAGRPLALRLLAGGLAAAGMLGGGSAPAWSASSADVTATIPVLIKSVTISTRTLAFGRCSGGYSTGAGLGFPNGTCTTERVTVTNGSAPSTILVSGANATPSDGGKAWALCDGPGAPPCMLNAPGTDQFTEQDLAIDLGLTPACDLNFASTPCGAAAPGQAKAESLRLYGPRSSTDQSTTFTTQITWTAR
jgi:hypothetical protein